MSKLPYKSDADIEKVVEGFLATHYKSKKLPIDVEHILQFSLKIDLNVVPRLKDLSGIECYINTAFTMITIDESYFNKYVARARFSIAHEIGHLVLHKGYYNSHPFNTTSEYIKTMQSITEADNKRLEIQANIFAGYLLMPTPQLNQEIKKITLALGGTKNMTITNLQGVRDKFADIFEVSEQVVEKQIIVTNKPWLGEVIGKDNLYLLS